METKTSQSHLLKPVSSIGSNSNTKKYSNGPTSSRRSSFESSSVPYNPNVLFSNPFQSIDENENLNVVKNINNNLHHQVSVSYTKIIFVVVLFLLSLIAFVLQTEATAYLYSELKFNEPFVLMMLTHGVWWISWPLQFTCIAVYKTLNKFRLHKMNPSLQEWKGFQKSFSSSVKAQHRNIMHSAELTANLNIKDYKFEYLKHSFKTYKRFLFSSSAIKYIFIQCFKLCIILNIAGSTWYVAMSLSTGSDVTAIYNCSAFTAYAFAIPILKEKFSYVKVSSVLVALFGVFIVTYSGKSDDSSSSSHPHRFLGNCIILIGAILYGLYEVYYKKTCCPPVDEVSARRQATFSNFTMSIIGLNTLVILFVCMLIAEVTGLHHFQIPPISEHKTWLFIWLSCFGNILFSFTFLALMALTSPVLSSVSSLVTIVIVGIVEYFVYGTSLNLKQILGYVLVLMGFVLLAYCSWNEISEEDKDDVLIDTDTESVMSASSSSINHVNIGGYGS